MTFYEILSEYYDEIFIEDINTINFLKESIEGKTNILDIACGTGTYAISLSNLGYNVIGIDIDKSMIKKAKEKNNKKNATFVEGDMLNLPEIIKHKKYDLIYCIGNSIVHLNDAEEINNVIANFNKLLKENGTIVLQIINYDRIINKNIDSLPTIKREKTGIEFIRKYKYNKENSKIIFKGTIVKHNLENDKIYNNEVLLTPILSEQLISILKNNYFSDIQLYGDFNKSTYNEDSYALVVRAKKAR